jgi:hypothetical protein
VESRASRPKSSGVSPGDSYTMLMLLGLTYIAALLISDFVGCVVALCAAILLSFGWPGRRIAMVMLLAGSVGALAAMAAFSLLLLIIGGSAPAEAFAMWGLGGFGWFGAASGAVAGAVEGMVAISSCFSIQRSAFCVLNSVSQFGIQNSEREKLNAECRTQNVELRNE